MDIRRHIPNLLTGTNLFSGMVALVFVVQGNAAGMLIAVAISLVMDFFDGFVARALKVSNPVGKELDSLADMVTFGAVPAMIMARLIQTSAGDPFPAEFTWSPFPLYLTGFLVAVFSAVRLAVFNLDESQSDSFRGLPTPANTMLIASYWLIVEWRPESFLAQSLNTPWVWVALSILSSWLLVANVRLIALKFKNYRVQDNLFRYILVISSLILLAVFLYEGIPFIILLYICLSLLQNYRNPG